VWLIGLVTYGKYALKVRNVLTPGAELGRSWGELELDRGGAEGGDVVTCFSWGRAEGGDDVTCGSLVSLDTANIHIKYATF
jgi:hypothetical protein